MLKLDTPGNPLRIALFVPVLLALSCAKPKAPNPDFVVFATGSLYGQLHTCG